MIRRDYILRLVEQFMETLSRIQRFKKDQLWEDAGTVLDEEFKHLIKQGAAGATEGQRRQVNGKWERENVEDNVRKGGMVLHSSLVLFHSARSPNASR